MRIQALLLTAALGLSGCFGASEPVNQGVVDLQRTMKAMGKEWKAINGSDDPAVIATHLANLHQLSSDASRAMVRKGAQPDYEAAMWEFLVMVEGIQATIAAGDADNLPAQIKALDDLRKTHHNAFKP
ncbi:hypothetical protein KUV89_01280 [Marinobacter hydrocarbonoclasticus]|nr:hypothetical protein [Marinobacter nauticus]